MVPQASDGGPSLAGVGRAAATGSAPAGSAPAAERWFDSVPGTRFDRVAWVAEIGSTNTELLRRSDRAGRPGPARPCGAEGEVLIADVQTAGRGRRGRAWVAPPGTSLMMSVLLRPPPAAIAPARASLVTSAWACAAADACADVAGVEPRLKWPNDLVVSAGTTDRKVAGILTESVIERGAVAALVVGMGLNTGWPAVPAELAGTATSLNLECGRPVDRVELARVLLRGFEARYARLCESGDARKLLAEVRRRSATLGRAVRVERDAAAGGTLAGVATDVDDDGALVVTDAAGTAHRVDVGDVVHLRPAAAAAPSAGPSAGPGRAP